MNKTEIQSLTTLLKDFYNLTQIKTCIYDADENELCFYPNKLSDFCALLRNDENFDSRCKECDKKAFAECRKTHLQYAYTCHAGLLECVSPIIFNNQIIGFIMIGQIKKEENANFQMLNKNLPSVSIEKLKKAYQSLPKIDQEKLASAFRILDACASYEQLKKLMPSRENSIDSQIDKFVRDNLSSPLSVGLLCRKFHLSHSEVYNIFKEYFNCTPADFIKKSRILHACNLLKTTNLPVNKIAKQCGIPDYNYFSKIFKKSVGVSPSEYRKTTV